MYDIHTAFLSTHRTPLTDCTIIGTISNIKLSSEVQHAMNQTFNVSVTTGSVIYRATVGRETYYSRNYHHAKVRNSYTVEYLYNTERHFGITPLTCTSDYCYPETLSVLRRKLVPVCVNSSARICVHCLIHKCVCIPLAGPTIIARLPNHLHGD